MTSKLILSLLFALTPAAVFAHGGHPQAGEAHAFAHLLWFGLPLALGVVGWVWVKRSRRDS